MANIGFNSGFAGGAGLSAKMTASQNGFVARLQPAFGAVGQAMQW